MHAPATALTWEFWGRHRWSLGAFGAFVAVCACITAVAPSANPEMFASLGSMWFLMGLCYLIVVFAYGSEVRLETADSGFPSRFFLLPVRTSVLVGWPMFQGMLAAVLVWAIWDHLVLRPCGIETPFWWAVMLAAVVATTQAILWVPFGLPWVRLPVAITVLTVLIRAPAFLALAGERFTDPDTENAILTVFAAVLIPVAFLLARSGVSRARRGDSPDWLRSVQALRRTMNPGRSRPPFSSPMRAQVWYEWRLRGLGFPLLVLFTLAILMAWGVFLERNDALQPEYAVILLCTPILLACFCGSYLGAAGDSLRVLFGLPAFTATRPMSNSGIVIAKLWTAALAAVVTWVMVVALTLGWLVCTGGVREISHLWERAVSHFGFARAGALGLLLTVGPVLVIWRLLVENLWVGLTGRAWVGHATAIVTATIGIQAIYEGTLWTADPGRQERLLTALPWIAGGAVVLKFVLAGWALRVLHRRGGLVTRSAVQLVGMWCLVAVSLFAVLSWFLPPGLVSVSELTIGIVLFLPLARLVVAPLALGWNRHR